MCWEASPFKTFKNVLQTAVNKEQAFDVPFYLFYQTTVILKKKAPLWVMNSHHPSYMVAASFTQDNQHFLFMFNMR